MGNKEQRMSEFYSFCSSGKDAEIIAIDLKRVIKSEFANYSATIKKNAQTDYIYVVVSCVLKPTNHQIARLSAWVDGYIYAKWKI